MTKTLIILATFFTFLGNAQSIHVKVEFPPNDTLFTFGYLTSADNKVRVDSSGYYTLTYKKSGKYEVIFEDTTSNFTRYTHFSDHFKIKVNRKSNDTIILNVKWACAKNELSAVTDFEQNNSSFIVFGGIAPPMYYPNNEFQIKYNVAFDITGCILVTNESCALDYNKKIAELLDKKFGRNWRDELPYLVLGI